MRSLFLQLYLLFQVTKPSATVREQPRMRFTEKETSTLRRELLEDFPAAKIFTDREDAVTIIGTTSINLIDFQNQQKVPVNLSVQWDECAKHRTQTKACNYNINVVHKSQETSRLFVCGTNGKDAACCNMNISKHSATCSASDKETSIKERIRDFTLKEGEASALIESPDSADLYITNSGAKGFIGIHRFGKQSVRPSFRDEEQHYKGLIVSKQGSVNGVRQDKVYGFYNEKIADTDMYSDMWKPYVMQICMTDNGGPKNNLQFTWTSQLNARLFCGDKEQKQHFFELLDLATVKAERWQDTTVYGLFQNEWGMRAVCVYKVQDIDHVFKTSPFKNSAKQPDRPRMCVADSTKLSIETLRYIESNCEMEKCIQSVNSSGPLLISNHHYTHIAAHNFVDGHNNSHAILFLSLHDGAVHKVKHRQSVGGAFIIAEYRPFNHKAHIVGMSLNPSTKKLYVTSGTEVVQVDVANCQRYGNFCEECVLARDPYCGWSDGRCTENGSLQDTERGDPTVCSTENPKHEARKLAADEEPHSPHVTNQISVPHGSRYFFECPVTSLHAQYRWYQDDSPVACSGAQHECFLLISSVQQEQEGTYTCESEEQGHTQQLVQYQLRVEDAAGGSYPGLVLWLGLMAVLFV